MRRPLASLWLAAPSRFAGLSVRGASVSLVLLATLLLATFLALATPGPAAADRAPADGQGDIVLYQSIVENVRHGGNYYAVTAEALRSGGYPLRPFVTFRLPTLARVEGALPPVAVFLMLYALVAATGLAWFRRLRPALGGIPPLSVATMLLAAGMIAFVQRDLVYFHEIWAGLLIALSMALRRPDRWLPSVAFGLAAVLVREIAAPYLMLMTLFAILEGNRREALGWLAGLGVLALVLLLHAQAVGDVVRATDPGSPGWAGMLGFGFFVKTMAISTALAAAPMWIAAPLIGLSLFGWATWQDDLGLRMLTLFAGYAVVLAVFGRADTFYWGLLIAPTLLVGLVFAPDGVRDLVAAASDRRRIIVRRVVR